VEAGITQEDLRLGGDHPALRRSRNRRRSPGPERRFGQPGRTRRPGATHAVIAATLAVVALVGCVIAVLMLATQPTATRLEGEIASLNARLGQAHAQLATLRSDVGHITAQQPAVNGDLHRFGARLTGLGRTVRGLQSSTALTQEQAAGLRDCIPQVQHEVAGLVLTTRSAKGRVTGVGLSDPTGLSASCEALFSGL
jgi:septal ring factor EnvC (AmiA/AmiB activator)